MAFLVTPSVTAQAVASAISLGMFGFGVRRRASPGGTAFSALMAAVVWWTLFAALEAAAVDQSLKVALSSVEYLGTVSTAPCFFLFALGRRTGDRPVPLVGSALLWLIPVATVAAIVSNPLHRLFWTGFSASPLAGSNLLVYGHGPLFYVHMGYSFLVTLSATILLVRAALGAQRVFLFQTAVLLAAALAPWVGAVFYLTPLNPWPGLDLIPLSFAVAGLLLFLAFSRFRLLELAPVALRQLFTRMADGLVVLDAENRVVDINPAARQIFGVEDNPVGRDARALAGWAGIMPARWGPGEDLIETPYPGDPPRHLDVRVTPIAGRGGRAAGRLVVIRDVTARREVELERERLIGELRQAIADIKTLRGLLPICAGCKKIRDDTGYWQGLEQYLSAHAAVQFSHGLCPDCLAKYNPPEASAGGGTP